MNHLIESLLFGIGSVVGLFGLCAGILWIWFHTSIEIVFGLMFLVCIIIATVAFYKSSSLTKDDEKL